VIVEVACAPRLGGQVELQFQVRDTGIGVPSDKLDTIFEAFEQADNSSTRRYGGTGLGLTISSRLVALMGGRVWVESELGRGSVFHFTVQAPVEADETADAAPRQTKALAELRVLAVDDNATNRLVLTEMLRGWSMRVETAAGAAEALKRLQQAGAAGERFDLIVTDLNMPEHDGFELMEWVRQDAALRETAAIMLTSADQLGDAARSRRLEIARRLTKPVAQSELLEAMLAALGIEYGGAPPAALGPSEPSSAEPLPPLHVLLVEDTLFNQKLAVGLLEKKGHRVTVADNGKEALRLLGEGDFDMVLMDLRMPEMDGMAATAAIRQREKATGGHLPIIALTAHAMTGDREKCLEAGMDGYLAKPIRAHELYAALATVLRQHAPV
jgi:CheY-like chemotaxis protein